MAPLLLMVVRNMLLYITVQLRVDWCIFNSFSFFAYLALLNASDPTLATSWRIHGQFTLGILFQAAD